MRALLLLLAALLLAPQARAWGPEGHAVIAEIAQHRLTPEAARAVEAILGPGVPLASIASWADEWRRAGHRETSRWHYVDIDLDAAGYDAARDCGSTDQGDCIVAALERFIAALSDPALPSTQKREALLFVVHLVGDLTQPLHCTERHHDAGGNRLFVTFEGRRERPPRALPFHALWDDTLIRELGVAAARPALDAASVQAGSLVDWADDCHRAGIAAYAALPAEAPQRNDRQTPITLGTAYAEAMRPLLETQLMKGGLRLAQVLNRALGPR